MTESNSPVRPYRVCVVIPHYYREGTQQIGYGSTRADTHLDRQIALIRCFGSILALARSDQDCILWLEKQAIVPVPEALYPQQRLGGVSIDLNVFVTDSWYLEQIIAHYQGRLRVHSVLLETPTDLPKAARSFLMESAAPADLYLYLEDDLVIQDRQFIDKLAWFIERTSHQLVLMPHRFEMTGDPQSPKLFVDGPLCGDYLAEFQQPQKHIAEGRFWDGQRVVFDLTNNPHSGCFAVSYKQLQVMRAKGVPDEGFVGPLETVATYSVLKHFPVVKPSWDCRDFLQIEHAHPSFLVRRSEWPQEELDV